MAGGVSIRNLTRRKAPRLPFGAVAKEVLPSWEISLVFVPEAKAKALNKKLRKKTYTPNVLSYEAGNKTGEIIICPQVAKQQAPSYGLTMEMFMLHLFIHGCLHLKGYPHGATMDRREQKLLAKFAKPPFAHH